MASKDVSTSAVWDEDLSTEHQDPRSGLWHNSGRIDNQDRGGWSEGERSVGNRDWSMSGDQRLATNNVSACFLFLEGVSAKREYLRTLGQGHGISVNDSRQPRWL